MLKEIAERSLYAPFHNKGSLLWLGRRIWYRIGPVASLHRGKWLEATRWGVKVEVKKIYALQIGRGIVVDN